MPITKVSGGYKWGKSGKTYPTRAGAARQARAAYASGYKGYKNGGPVPKNYNRAVSIPGSGIANLPVNFPGFPSPSPGSVGINVSPQGLGIGKNIDPGTGKGSQSIKEYYRDFIRQLLGEGNVSAAAAQRFRDAGPSTAMALQKIGSGVYTAPGGDTSLRGAKGRNTSMRGLMRARRKEQNAYKRAVKNAAMKYDPTYWVTNYGLSPEQAASAAERYKAKYSPEYFANQMKEKNMGLGSVLRESWDSFADSRGVPYNIDELMAASGGDG